MTKAAYRRIIWGFQPAWLALEQYLTAPSWDTTMRQIDNGGNRLKVAWIFCDLKVIPQERISFNKITSPNTSQTVSPTGDIQIYEHIGAILIQATIVKLKIKDLCVYMWMPKVSIMCLPVWIGPYIVRLSFSVDLELVALAQLAEQKILYLRLNTSVIEVQWYACHA